MSFYSTIHKSYNELYGEEQIKKLALIKQKLKIKEPVLDIGCGTFLSKNLFKNIIGIDPSFNMIKNSRNVIQAKAEFLPFKDSSFPTVISITAIQNFDDIETAIKEIKRIATNLIIITTIKKSPKLQLIKSLLKEFKILEEEKDLIFYSRLASSKHP